MDFLQLADADLRVNLRGGQFGVAKHLLDKPDVGPILQHQRGHRVPEQVATAAFAKLGGVNVFPHHLREPVTRERLVEVGQEQRAVVRLAHQRGTNLDDVFINPRQRPRANRDHPVFLALAQADHHRAPLDVEVVKFERSQFTAPHVGAVKRFEDGPVTHAQRVGDVGLVQHPVGFAGRQHMLGQPLFHLGHVQFAGRVVERVVLAGTPFEEGPHRHQVRELAAEGQRLAVVVSGSWAGCCAGFFVVKTSEELRIKIGPGADGFQTNIGQLSDNSRTQNQLTTLEVRRAVSNAPCYVRPLPWQGEQRPASNQASSIQSGFIRSSLRHCLQQPDDVFTGRVCCAPWIFPKQPLRPLSDGLILSGVYGGGNGAFERDARVGEGAADQRPVQKAQWSDAGGKLSE